MRKVANFSFEIDSFRMSAALEGRQAAAHNRIPVAFNGEGLAYRWSCAMNESAEATQTAAVPSNREELLAAARDLQPLLREYAAQIETERRLPDVVADRLEETGLWRMRRPKEQGGLGLSVRDQVEITSELGRGCPSTGYMVAMLNGTELFHAIYSPETQEEFHSDPKARSCVVFRPSSDARRVEGGWVISGKWPYATGCMSATHADVDFWQTDENGVTLGKAFALVPLSEMTIEDTWQVVALEGTGSFTVAADEVFVPDARVSDVKYDGPAFGIGASLNVSSSLVGIAEGMFDAVLAKLAEEKPIMHTSYRRAMDSPTVQVNMAEARQVIDGARFHMYRAAETLDDSIAEARELTVLERARARADVGTASKLVRDACELLLNVAGPSAFQKSSPIQRYWRALQLGSRHGYINYDITREAYGKALLGLDVSTVTEAL